MTDGAASRPSSFAALAFELRLVAQGECTSNAQVEHFLARHPNESLSRVLTDLRRTAALIGEAAMLLANLAPFEREVRALGERNAAPSEENVTS